MATERSGAAATCQARTNVAIQTRRFNVVRRARRTSTATASQLHVRILPFSEIVNQSINQFICPETNTLDRTPMEVTTPTWRLQPPLTVACKTM